MSMYPLPKGFIIIAKKSAMAEKLVVSYKLISFENGTMSPITKSVYQLAKFGNNFKTFEMQVPNYVTCKTASLDNQRLFVVTPDGTAKVMDHNGYVQWQGTMKYKGYGPSDISVQGHTMWASFPENNGRGRCRCIYFKHDRTMISYNMRSGLCRKRFLSV